MATPIAVFDLVQVKIYNGQLDQLGLNVVHYKVVAVGGAANYEDGYANDFSNHFAPSYTAFMTNNALFYGATIQRILPGIPTVPFLPFAYAPIPGGAGTVPLPFQTSGHITIRTSLAGRRYRGRVYPPFLDSVYDDGTGVAEPTTLIAALSPIATAIGATQTYTHGGNSAVFEPVIYSKKFNLQTQVIGCTSRGTYATQRRRGQTGRPNQLPPF